MTSTHSDEFSTLYRKHAPGAFRRALTLLKSEAEAHEVVQEIFLSLYVSPEQFGAKSAITTSLYSATTHACLNRLRNQRTRARLLARRVNEPVQEGALGPDGLSALRAALERMPEPLAQVAVYHYFDELTYDEIAALLGCSRRQVANHLQRLHQWISEQEPS